LLFPLVFVAVDMALQQAHICRHFARGWEGLKGGTACAAVSGRDDSSQTAEAVYQSFKCEGMQFGYVLVRLRMTRRRKQRQAATQMSGRNRRKSLGSA
jgi:hypothetical protein